MPVTDTSWLFALVNDLDIHHEKALADARKADRLLVPSLVLAETLQLTYFRARQELGEAQAHRSERHLRQDVERIVGVQLMLSYDAKLAAAIHDRHLQLSYVDAAAIALALRSGESLLTFDLAQSKALKIERKAL